VIRTSVRAAAAALLVAAALSGCGTNARPVARVAGRTLTVEDFLHAARGNEGTLPGAPDQAKAAMLKELVQRELVLVAAHAHGLDTLAATRNFHDATERKALLTALYQQFAPDAGVSEGEIRAFYERRREQEAVQLIYCTEEGVMRQAQAKLAAGVPFSEVADRYNEPGALPPGGALGMRSPGDLFPPIDDALANQKVGVVGGPWHTAQGWFMLRLASRVPNAQPPYEEARPALGEKIRQRKLNQAITTSLLALEQGYHLEVTNDGPAMLFLFLEPARVLSAPHWMPSDAEQRAPLATWDDGAYTMGDAMKDLLNSVDTRGPDASSIGAVRSWIQSEALMRVCVTEARTRHLGEETAVKYQVDDAMASHLTEGDLMQAVSVVPPPPEAEVRATWDAVKGQYPQLRRARLAWIASADTSLVAAVAHRAAPGVPLRLAARAVAASIVVHDEVVSFPTTSAPWGPLQPEIAGLAVGGWSQPLFTGADWRIVQLEDRDQGPLAWEELTAAQQAQVTRTVGDRARQTRFGAYMDSLWKADNPVLLPENLRKVEWPSPAPSPMMTMPGAGQ